MNITKDIPDGEPADRRFLCVVMLDGYGKPEQLRREFRKAMENLLYQEFGVSAKLTSMTETAHERRRTEEDPLSSDDPVVLTGDTDTPVVEG